MSICNTCLQELPLEAHLNDTDHDTERGALWEDYRLMFGHNPTTSNLSAVRAAIDSGEPL
ncbi:MAG: hypothetical protein GXP38_05030 [Chloroflexi bacterium]|nr:hypothetical protein [Chloroflexota bacterium]